MNVAVINLKGISKNFIKLTFGLVALFFIIKVLIINLGVIPKIFSFESCSLAYTSFFAVTNKQEKNINYLAPVKAFYPIIIAAKDDKKTQESIPKEIINEEQIKISKQNANVEAVSEKNLSENYNITYSNVKIRNQSNYDLSDDVFSPEGLELSYNKKILIYHTHTCESYTPSGKYNYTMTGNYRTTDKNYSVVKLRR